MNAHVQKALLLYEQSRYAQAEAEFRQGIAETPGVAYSHAMLALCLAQQERFDESTQEISRALELDPGEPFVHYARAFILDQRGRHDEALTVISEAIQLNPEDPDFFALESRIHLNQRAWTKALASAEQGLTIDAEHVDCANFRAMALTRLNRRAEAGQTIDAALARDPENSTTHANQGWTLLHSGDHQRALEHFREALRIEPGNEWARQGVIEALKAQYLLYAWMLKFFLWMSRLDTRVQWAIVLGGFFGSRILSSISRNNPAFAPFIFPIQFLYLVFVFLTWAADPLFNLVLRLNKFGRLVLNREETIASNWVGGFLALAVLCALLSAFVHSYFLVGAFVFCFSVMPLAAVFKCQHGWPRFTMQLYTAVVAGAGVLHFLLPFFPGLSLLPRADIKGLSGALFSVFILGIIGTFWIGNILVMQRVRK